MLVGSSSNKISGFCIKARANKSLDCCQPENLETILSSGAFKLTTSKISIICLSILKTVLSGKYFLKYSHTVKSLSSGFIT